VDSFLATTGLRGPQQDGKSANAGKIAKISISKGNAYLNNFWTPFARVVPPCNLDVPDVYRGPGAEADSDKTPTYKIRLIFNPQACQEIEEACVALVYAAHAAGNPKFAPVTYGDKVYSLEARLFDPTVPTALQLASPLLDGNIRYAKDPVNDAIYQGVKYLNAKMYPTSSATSGIAQRPTVIDMFGKEGPPTLIHAGDYGAVMIDLGTYSKGGTGVRAGFTVVRMVAEGDKIATGFNRAGAAVAEMAHMEPMNFGSFATQPAAAPAGYGQTPPGAVPQGYPTQPNGAPAGYGQLPPGGVPAQPPAGYSAPQGYPVQPPAPVWNPQTAQWELPQPAQQAASPTQAAWTPPPAGPNGFAPPPGQLPQQAALPPGAYPPPR
jgi:hypothetical protein